MRKIAVIGIAGESVFLSVEKFGQTGETTVASDYYCELGGKGFNQAIAAARHGCEVAFLGAAYEGDADRFEKIARECGINAQFVKKSARSPYAVIMTDAVGDNRVCVYRGAELSIDDVEAFKVEIEAADILLITNEVPKAVNERAVEIAVSSGTKVILNPAPVRQNDKAFLDKIYLFTPNEHETIGLDDYNNVIVTMGDKGCFIKEYGETIPAVKTNAVDTTGAGDTFSGILAACVASGDDFRSACKKANVGAAIKVSRKHILNSIPTKEEIERFVEK
jgi:ribokinase